MIYRITWKYLGRIFAEEGDLKHTTEVLEFLDRNADNGYTLVSVTEAIG